MGNDELDDQLQGAFQDRFDHESATPPEAVWKNVRSAILVEKKRRRFLFWLIPGILLCGAGILAALFLLFNRDTVSGTTMTTATAASHRNTAPVSRKTNDEPIASTDMPVSATSKTPSGKPASGSATTTQPVRRQQPLAARQRIYPSGSQVVLPTDWHALIATAPVSSDSATGHSNRSSTRISATGTPGEPPVTDNGSPLFSAVPPMLATDSISAGTRIPETDSSLAQLPPKSVLPWLIPSAIAPMNPFLPAPFPKWSFGLEIGIGRNNRNISGMFNDGYKSLDLVSKDIHMANRCFGFSFGHRFNPYISVQSGITTGVDSYTSRWFLRLLGDKGPNETYDFRTSEGNMRMASTDVDDYFQNSDSTLFRMRLHYRARYFSIPLSVKLALPGQKIAPYLRVGASYDAYVNNRTAVYLISPTNGISRSVNLSRADRRELHSTQLLLGIGLETRRNAAWQFFVEPQLSIPLSPIYRSANFSVTSQYVQVRAGMTLYF